MKAKKLAVFVLLLMLPHLFLFSEDHEPLPDGYKTVSLGMTSEETKAALKQYASFGYRGDRDVSLLPDFDRLLIETTGDGFLEKCWFQFYEDRLYTMIININQEIMDYYSIFKTLCQKYGSPDSFAPDRAIWEDDNVQLCLEKPLCLKYSDVQALEKIQGRSVIEQSTADMLRQDFLEGL